MLDARPWQEQAGQGASGGIECRHVSHFFAGQNGQDVHVLDDINLDIRPASFVSLLGPSGCGKTTLLRMIDGLIIPDAGEIHIGGAPVRGPAADRAMVFQEHNLLPWKTALENAEFGCKLIGVPAPQRRSRALEALATMGLAEFTTHYPSQLSGGMKQRIGLARALATRPRTLLMDEPFGALDAQTRELMQDELLRIWEADRKTVVFVTHSIDEAITLSDQVVVMSHRPGRVREVVDIDLPRPRAGMDEEIRDTPEWTAYRRRLWRLLKPELLSSKVW